MRTNNGDAGGKNAESVSKSDTLRIVGHLIPRIVVCNRQNDERMIILETGPAGCVYVAFDEPLPPDLLAGDRGRTVFGHGEETV